MLGGKMMGLDECDAHRAGLAFADGRRVRLDNTARGVSLKVPLCTTTLLVTTE